MAKWVPSNTIVYGPAVKAAAWEQLDLSAVVGAQKALVLLYLGAGSGNATVAFRPNGDADDWYDADNAYSRGSCNVSYNVAVADSCVFVLTDANGIVEWYVGGGAWMTVTVVGYIDSPSIYLGAAVSAGALGAGDNDIDISAIVGTQRALVFLKVKATSAWLSTDYWFTKERNGVGSWLNSPNFTYSATNKLNKCDLNDAFGMIGITDANGILQIENVGTGQGDIYVMAYVAQSDGWLPPTPGNEVFFPAAAAPVAYTDCDMSSAAIADSLFTLIKITKSSGTAGVAVRSRANGTAYDVQDGGYAVNGLRFTNPRTAMFVCDTDSDGIIEWSADAANTYELELLGYMISSETVGPWIVRVEPSGPVTSEVGSIDVVIQSDIPFDATSLNLSVTNPIGDETNIIVGGVVAPGFTGTVNDLGKVLIAQINTWPDSILLNGQVWTFTVEATDLIGKSL